MKHRDGICVELVHDLLSMNLDTLRTMQAQQNKKEAAKMERSLLNFQAKCQKI